MVSTIATTSTSPTTTATTTTTTPRRVSNEREPYQAPLHSQQPQPPKARQNAKSCRFHNTVFVQEIPGHQTYSAAERDATWYAPEDFARFKLAIFLHKFSDLYGDKGHPKKTSPNSDGSPKPPPPHPQTTINTDFPFCAPPADYSPLVTEQQRKNHNKNNKNKSTSSKRENNGNGNAPARQSVLQILERQRKQKQHQKQYEEAINDWQRTKSNSNSNSKASSTSTSTTASTPTATATSKIEEWKLQQQRAKARELTRQRHFQPQTPRQQVLYQCPTMTMAMPIIMPLARTGRTIRDLLPHANTSNTNNTKMIRHPALSRRVPEDERMTTSPVRNNTDHDVRDSEYWINRSQSARLNSALSALISVTTPNANTPEGAITIA